MTTANTMLVYSRTVKMLKTGLFAFYDLWPGTVMGLFSKKQISKEANEPGKNQVGKLSNYTNDLCSDKTNK